MVFISREWEQLESSRKPIRNLRDLFQRKNWIGEMKYELERSILRHTRSSQQRNCNIFDISLVSLGFLPLWDVPSTYLYSIWILVISAWDVQSRWLPGGERSAPGLRNLFPWIPEQYISPGNDERQSSVWDFPNPGQSLISSSAESSKLDVRLRQSLSLLL